MRDYCTCLILTRHGNHISGSMDSLISLEYGPTMCQRFRQNGVRTSRRRMSRQKRDHWSSQCHQGSCGDFWRWKFRLQSAGVTSSIQTFCTTHAVGMDDSDSSTIFSISSSKGPSRAVEQPRDVSPRRQEGTWRGKTTWDSRLMWVCERG